MAIVRALVSNSAMSSSRSAASAILLSVPTMLQPPTFSSSPSICRAMRGECLGRRAVARGGRRAGVRCLPEARATAAAGRGTARRAASPTPPPRPDRTGRWSRRNGGMVARHILDDAEHRHAGLAEQVDRPRRIDQRQVLRRRNDHRAGRPRFLDQRQLDVAGAWRQVDERYFGIAPIGIDQLGERARWPSARATPAPGPAETSCPSDSKLDALRLDRDQLVVFGRAACRSCRAGSAATGRRCRRRRCRPSCPSAPAQPRDWRLASTCRPRPCPSRWR